VKFNPPLEVSDADTDLLADALECDVKVLASRLAGHAQAAVAEYVEMYLGRRAFSRGSDILEHRLALLMEYPFANQVPAETQVARLFQVTLPASRSLIRSALSKYRYQLRAATTASAKATLESAKLTKNDQFLLEIKVASLVDLMNQSLAAKDGREKPVLRVADSVSNYSTARSSYEFLCQAFGATPIKE